MWSNDEKGECARYMSVCAWLGKARGVRMNENGARVSNSLSRNENHKMHNTRTLAHLGIEDEEQTENAKKKKKTLQAKWSARAKSVGNFMLARRVSVCVCVCTPRRVYRDCSKKQRTQRIMKIKMCRATGIGDASPGKFDFS